MAATEVVDLSFSDDEEFQKPSRKPIGWNYQLGVTKPKKAITSANGSSATTARAASPPPPPPPDDDDDDDDDDLEVLEVNIEPKEKLSLMPSSSSRSEIRKQFRGIEQSSISNFLVKRKTPPEDTSEKKNKERKGEEKQDEDDKSTATLKKFIRRWKEIRIIDKDDEKIRDKLWKHYHLAQTSYTHSKKFIQIIEASTQKLTSDNIYIVIKDILDCLKQYKDMPYREKESGAESAGTSREGTPTPIDPENSKINKRLKKVEKKMKELSDKIKELENQEVELDDEDNSAYLVEDRIKRQFTKLHEYYCRLANCSTAIGRPIEKKFKYKGSRWDEINKRITAWVNKYKEFPDYVDILNLVKKVTKQSSLPLRPETIRVQAQEIFRDVGKILKYRRESDDLYSIYSYVEEESEDPALQDEALDHQLKENEKIATEKLNKVFQEFVEKDGQQQESADVDRKPASETKGSPVKDVLRTAECKMEEEETVTTEGENKVKEEVKVESKAGIPELGITLVKVCDTGTNSGEAAEDDDEDPSSNAEEGTSSEDHFMSDSEENDDEDTSVEEDERQDTKEGSTQETSKVDEELDDGDDTDDDVKALLNSACIDEEEEYYSEDVSVISTEELPELESIGGENSDKKSVLCLDDISQGCEGSDQNSVLCVEDDNHEVTATIPTAQNNNNNNNNNHLPTTHTEEQNSSTTANVATPPKASVDTRTNSPTDTSKQQEKRKSDESLPPCKKLCVSDT